MKKTTRTYLCVAGGAVILAASIVCFIQIGLDRGDKLASVISAVTGILSLGLTAYGIVSARQGALGRKQTVVGTRVGCDLTQANDVRGNVSTGRGHSTHLRSPTKKRKMQGTKKSTAKNISEGQHVVDSDVGGSVTQIGDLQGDLNIGRVAQTSKEAKEDWN